MLSLLYLKNTFYILLDVINFSIIDKITQTSLFDAFYTQNPLIEHTFFWVETA